MGLDEVQRTYKVRLRENQLRMLQMNINGSRIRVVMVETKKCNCSGERFTRLKSTRFHNDLVRGDERKASKMTSRFMI